MQILHGGCHTGKSYAEADYYKTHLLKESDARKKWRSLGVEDPYISQRVHENGQPSLFSEEQHCDLEEAMNRDRCITSIAPDQTRAPLSPVRKFFLCVFGWTYRRVS